MKRSLCLFATLATAWSAAALADSTSTVTAPGMSAVSQTTAAAVSPAPKKMPLNAIAINDFYGPALTGVTSRETADSAQGAKMGLNSHHQIGLTYLITENTVLAPMLDFNLTYTHPVEIGSSERNFTWNDCYVKLGQSGIAETKIAGNAIALDGDVRYLLPTAKGSRDTDSRGSVRVSLNPSIQFGKSNFSFSMVNYARYYLYRDSSEVPGATAWKVYTGPQLNYSVNDNITPFVLLEAVDFINNKGYSLAATKTAPGAPVPSLADLEPGVSITINKNLQVTPYLNWFLNQPIDTASVNLNATLKLF